MQRRNFLQTVVLAGAFATGITNANASLPINFDAPVGLPGLYPPAITLPNGLIQTQLVVGEECLFKSLDEVRQWMQTNTWQDLKIIVNTDGINYTWQDCMSVLPSNFIEKKVSILLQVYENLRFKES